MLIQGYQTTKRTATLCKLNVTNQQIVRVCFKKRGETHPKAFRNATKTGRVRRIETTFYNIIQFGQTGFCFESFDLLNRRAAGN